MARITTKSGLIEYTKSQLGAPIINIEVTPFQIGEIIDEAIQIFTEYAYGTLEDIVIIDLDGRNNYTLPSTITNIIKLSRGNNGLTNFNAQFGGYVPDLWSEQRSGSDTFTAVGSLIDVSATRSSLDKFFGDELNYNFNYNKKILQMHESYTGKALLYYQYEYIADDDNDLIFNHEWIKKYTKAKTKELWGTITGKFDQTLVGGARINYDRLLSEAQQELDYLKEELISKWSDPAPIDIG